MSGAPAADRATGPVPVLEIGGSHVTGALADPAAGIVLAGTVRRDPLSASGTAATILGAIVACGRSLPAPAGAPWGVAIPGPFDYQRGVGLFADVGKFDSLYGVDVRAALAAGLPGPPGPIRFLNDAQAFLRGEWLFGAAVGHDRCAGITLGTGVGSAFLAGGAVCDTGPQVPPGGRVDLLRIDGQPLENVISSRAISAAYQRRTRGQPLSVAQIAQQASRGDPAAGDVLRTAFERLGAALSPWLAAFGATVLVVGGSMTGSWNLIGPALRAGIGHGSTPPAHLVVTPATRGDHAALLGAAAWAQMRDNATAHKKRDDHPVRHTLRHGWPAQWSRSGSEHPHRNPRLSWRSAPEKPRVPDEEPSAPLNPPLLLGANPGVITHRQHRDRCRRQIGRERQ
jgi:glucokinase